MAGKRHLAETLQIAVALLSIVGVVAALVVVPEVRQAIGLDKPTPSASAAPSPASTLAVFFDDDGSLDGTAGLLYLLSRDDVDVRAITISYGEAHPAVYAQHVARLLDDLGTIDIPVGAGQDAPLAGNNAFPHWMRELSDEFWTVSLPNQDRNYRVENAVQLMATAIIDNPTAVTVFSSGSLTNLALALQENPDIRNNITAVYIMGGAVDVPGNIRDLEPASTNSMAEWNLYVDPRAADQVFTSGLPLYLVPLDATNQVTINIEDTRLWRTGGKAAGYAADLYDHSFVNYGMQVTEIWDLLATVVMVDPDLCRFQPRSVKVVTDQGNAAGQLITLPDGAANVSVCLQPDPDLVRQRMIEVFSGSR